MRLLLVRHGQSQNNAGRAQNPPLTSYPGRVPDPRLTQLGRVQSEKFADHLGVSGQGERITHLYISRMVRTAQTMAPIAQVVGLPVVVHPDAHEAWGLKVRGGPGESDTPAQGASYVELLELCPQVVVPADVDPDEAWHGGMESTAQIRPRAVRLLGDLVASHGADDVVLMVTHRQLVKFLVAQACGIHDVDRLPFQLHNTGVVELCLRADRWSVEYYNRVDHLVPAEHSD